MADHIGDPITGKGPHCHGVGLPRAGEGRFPSAIHRKHPDLPGMSFRFQSDEAPETALHRMLCEQTRQACARLKRRPDHSAVHEVRRGLKRVGSLLEWVRSGVGDRRLRRWRRRLDRCSSELSEARDAFVRFQSLSLLPVEVRTGIPRRSWDGLVRHLKHLATRRARLLGDGGRARRVRTRREELLGEFRSVSPSVPEWPELGEGVCRSYRRCRRDLGRVRTHPSTMNRHRWRQSIQSLGDQLALLQPTASASMSAWAWGLQRLRGHLGRDHDLWLLRQSLRGPASDALSKTERDSLLRAIRSLRREAAADAVRLGSRLFFLPTRRFFPAVDRLWHASRSASDADPNLDLASDSWSGRSRLEVPLGTDDLPQGDTTVGDRSRPAKGVEELRVRRDPKEVEKGGREVARAHGP